MADLTGHFSGRIGSFPCSQGKMAARIGGTPLPRTSSGSGLAPIPTAGAIDVAIDRAKAMCRPPVRVGRTRDIYWKFWQIFSDPGELNFFAVPLDFASVHQVLDHADPPFELTDIYWGEADDAVGRVTAA